MLLSGRNTASWCLVFLAGLTSLGCRKWDHQPQSVCTVMQLIIDKQQIFRSYLEIALEDGAFYIERAQGEPPSSEGGDNGFWYHKARIERYRARTWCDSIYYQMLLLNEILEEVAKSGSVSPTQEQLFARSIAAKSIPSHIPCLLLKVSDMRPETPSERLIATKAWVAESEAREREMVQACRKVVEAQ